MIVGLEGRLGTDCSSGFLLFLSSVRRPQIEKIVTLIGAGIESSRDQHYATPGRVLLLLPPHASVFHRLMTRN